MLALYLIYHCNHHIHTFACRTFDVNDTGRISESKFRQILATKQVPEDDVEGILEGENTSPHGDQILTTEYRKLDVGPSDTNSVDGSEEQILYKGPSNDDWDT